MGAMLIRDGGYMLRRANDSMSWRVRWDGFDEIVVDDVIF